MVRYHPVIGVGFVKVRSLLRAEQSEDVFAWEDGMGGRGAQTGNTCRPLTNNRPCEREEWPPLESAKVLELLPPSEMVQERQVIVGGRVVFRNPPLRRQALPFLLITRGDRRLNDPRCQICLNLSFFTWMVLLSSTARDRDVSSWRTYPEGAKTVAARAKLSPTRNCRLAAGARTQPRQPATA
jgi:hypothetical protein